MMSKINECQFNFVYLYTPLELMRIDRSLVYLIGLVHKWSINSTDLPKALKSDSIYNIDVLF